MTKRLDREGLKKQKRYDNARAELARFKRRKRCKASRFIRHVDKFIKQTDDALLKEQIKGCVLYCRVSSSEQRSGGNLKKQKQGALLEHEKRGIKVRATYSEVAKGSDLEESQRPKLVKAFKMGAKHDMPVSIVCTSRAARSVDFHTKWNPNATPSIEEMNKLEAMRFKHNPKHPIVCLLDPDATPSEEKGYLSKLSREATGSLKNSKPRKKYPGYRKEAKADYFDKAIEMSQNGINYQDIAKHVAHLSGFKINRKTIREWVLSATSSQPA